MRTNYNYDNGIATFNIYYKDKVFKGKAYCSSQDKDMESIKTGLFIAESRANILLSKHLRDNEYKPQIQGLQDLLSFLGPNNNEEKIISYIDIIDKKINTINKNIEVTEKYLADYIEQKDKLYKRLRKVKKC